VQVPLVDVGGQEDVQRLRLTDVFRTVAGMVDQPALVDFECGLEDVLFLVRQEVQMLDRAFIDGDGGPGVVVIFTLFRQQLGQMPVAHGKGSAQRFVGKAVGRDRLDPRRGAAADDRNGGRRRDRHLVGEPLHDAEFRRIGTGTALFGQLLGGFVGFRTDMLEHARVPDFRHDPLHGDHHGLHEGVEAHRTEPDRAFAHGGIFRAGEIVWRIVDEVLQDIVEETHDVPDEVLFLLPFQVFL